jgi:hypothetical protein
MRAQINLNQEKSTILNQESLCNANCFGCSEIDAADINTL